MLKPPPNNLPPEAFRLGEWLKDGVRSADGNIKRVEQDTKNSIKQTNSSMGLLSEQVRDLREVVDAQAALLANLSAVVADVQEQQAYLNSLAPVSAGSNAGLTIVGAGQWATGSLRPSASIKISTGRIRVTVGGFSQGIYGVYSIPGYVTRESRIAGNLIYSAYASTTGGTGVNFVGGQRFFYVQGLPVGETIAVYAEFYGDPDQSGGLLAYPSIAVENIP